MKIGIKNKKIFIIALIGLIIFILAIMTLGKMGVFLNKKQKFVKCISQVLSTEEKEKIEKYMENKEKSNYKNEGELKCEFNANKDAELSVEKVGVNLKFNGLVDNKNGNIKQNFVLDYGKGVEVPFKYTQIKDEVGIQAKCIGSKSIVVDNPITEYKERIQEQTNIEDEESQKTLKNIKQAIKYMIEDIEEGRIIEVKEKFKGYQLEFTEDDVKESLKKALERIKRESKEEKDIDKIDELLEILNEEGDFFHFGKEKIKLTLFEEKRKLKEIKFEVKKLNFRFIFNQEGNYLEMKGLFTFDDAKEQIEAKAGIKDISKIKNATEYAEIIIKNEYGEYKYDYINNIEEQNKIDIEDFNSKNSVILKKLEEEKKNEFLKSIQKRLVEVDKKNMEKLGIKELEGNPILYIFPPINNLIFTDSSLLDKAKEANKNSEKVYIEEMLMMQMQEIKIKEIQGEISKEEKIEEFIRIIDKELNIENIKKIDEQTVSFEYKNKKVIVNIETMKVAVE